MGDQPEMVDTAAAHARVNLGTTEWQGRRSASHRLC